MTFPVQVPVSEPPPVDVWVNVAVTETFEFIVTVHVTAVPEQAPDQPANVEPELGVAVTVTAVPAGKLRVLGPQEGVDDGDACAQITPLPVPDAAVVRVYCCATSASKFATTSLSPSIFNVHAPDPEQSPPHLTGEELESGVPVNVTSVSSG